ncbi:MAG TPA: metalloregulator ArsR/SmtB family transcription factor [Verrucomicrobiae bacterium]|nr:metalloregulator ArsR/SmtB family transcription factor [Verrucomicrobiae bacterium]
MKEWVAIAKALSDPTRLRVLFALRTGELCVCELCDVLGVTQSTLSTHLQVIRQAGLVSSRREGKWSYYQIRPHASLLLRRLGEAVPTGESDKILRRDAGQLQQRLALRDNGSCCVGFKSGQTTGDRE